MLDLKDNLGISYAAMSNAFSAMCIGICTGALSTGALSRVVPSRELSAFILLLISASLVSSYTYWLDYRHFVGANFAVGVTTGAAIATCEAWILELWGKDCGPWMQALQFFRGLGYIIGPVLADPFLSLEVEDRDGEGDLNATEPSSLSSTPSSPTEEIFQPQTTTTSVPYNSAIHIPYLINAGLLFLGAALLLGLYAYRLFKTSGSCGGGSSTFDLTK
ncbi:PREDICTED: major facilitator superfamily domain-containing protein 4B-like, partial [Rhagoletis zephyria]|uniref:major facilitator superfamily domain-containing protein 4B-like n=1 Tax=Rhagoletis zephyria TaxID=28612 RepID=UPI0008115619